MALDVGKALKSKTLVVGVLSMSLLMSASNAVSGTIPAMKEAFSDYSAANVELLTTVPTIGSMVGTALTGLFANAIGRKKIAMAGFLISAVTGVIPAFFPYYWPILISRMFFGFGSALFVTLSVSYITDLYDGDMQRKLLGWRQAVGNLGDVVLLFVASLLITINWQSTYLIFFLLFVPMVLVGMFIPKEFDDFSIRSALVDDEGHVVDKSASQKQTTNWQVLWLAFIFLVVSMIYNVMSIKLASYVVDEGIGSASLATLIFSFLVVATILSGVLFDKVAKVTKRLTVTISEVVIGICFIATALTKNVPLMFALVLIAGFAWGIINPALTARFVDYSPAHSMNLTTSIVIIGINIGCLISPYFFALTASVFGNSSAGFAIIVGGALYFVMVVIELITLKVDKKLTV